MISSRGLVERRVWVAKTYVEGRLGQTTAYIHSPTFHATHPTVPKNGRPCTTPWVRVYYSIVTSLS